jgi:hypothetical protein
MVGNDQTIANIQREMGDRQMTSIKGLIALGVFSLVVLALPSVASAQWRDRDRDDDYYGRNGGYGNGSYNRNIRGTIQNLKNRAKNFEKTTNRVEDRQGDRNNDRWGNNRTGGWGNNRNGGWYGNGNVGRIEDLADQFKRATDKLADRYGNGRNLRNSEDEARRVLDIGNQIDQELRNVRGGQQLSREWNMIRRDLDAVASVYGYGNNNRNRNGTYNRNGDWRNRIPFPLPF